MDRTAAIDLDYPVTYDTLPFGICEGKHCNARTTTILL